MCSGESTFRVGGAIWSVRISNNIGGVGGRKNREEGARESHRGRKRGRRIDDRNEEEMGRLEKRHQRIWRRIPKSRE